MTYTRLEAAKHRKWFIYSSRRCVVPASSSFSSVFQLCSVILLFGTCVFVCVCAHTSIVAGNDEENTHSTYASSSPSPWSSYNINSVVGCFRACADNNQLLNYISLYGSFHFGFLLKHPWQASRTWVSDFFSFLCNSRFFLLISNANAIDMASSVELPFQNRNWKIDNFQI